MEKIYSIEKEDAEDDESQYEYYMTYGNKELNIIERLVGAGLIEDKNKNKNEELEDNTNTILTNADISNNTMPVNNIANSNENNTYLNNV